MLSYSFNTIGSWWLVFATIMTQMPQNTQHEDTLTAELPWPGRGAWGQRICKTQKPERFYFHPRVFTIYGLSLTIQWQKYSFHFSKSLPGQTTFCARFKQSTMNLWDGHRFRPANLTMRAEQRLTWFQTTGTGFELPPPVRCSSHQAEPASSCFLSELIEKTHC